MTKLIDIYGHIINPDHICSIIDNYAFLQPISEIDAESEKTKQGCILNMVGFNIAFPDYAKAEILREIKKQLQKQG